MVNVAILTQANMSQFLQNKGNCQRKNSAAQAEFQKLQKV